MGKKLKLNDLKIQSFVTNLDAGKQKNVKGKECSHYLTEELTACMNTCNTDCGTCFNTCDATCVYTCDPDCTWWTSPCKCPEPW